MAVVNLERLRQVPLKFIPGMFHRPDVRQDERYDGGAPVVFVEACQGELQDGFAFCVPFHEGLPQPYLARCHFRFRVNDTSMRGAGIRIFPKPPGTAQMRKQRFPDGDGTARKPRERPDLADPVQ